MKNFKLISFIFFIALTLAQNVFAADVIDSIEEEDRAEADAQAASNNAPNLVNETIKSISASKKIFILTNESNSYSRGDYISILIQNQLVCRALVAKTTNEKLSGIKIVKIYNPTLWKQLSNNKEVLILKGDDSYYSNKPKAVANDGDKKSKKDELKIQSEEDLFNTTTVSNDDDQTFEENNKRLIKPDNLLGLKYSMLQSKTSDGSSTRYAHIAGDWGYQIGDNVWAEFGVGTNTIRDYPDVTGDGGLDTRLISYSVRLKYTINAPFYSYIMPYAGYQLVTASSPGAGQQDVNNPQSDSNLAKELQLVDDLKKSGPIFGVTIMRRIVPGWFARLDLGTDLIGGGISLEF